MAEKKRKIAVFCAHPDDEVIGPGGTLLKYAKAGIECHVIIFSGGEMSHSLYNKKKLVKLRERESVRAGEILEISKIVNLGLRDMHLKQDVLNPEVQEKVKNIIKRINPEKVFTHAIDDMLFIDHRAVHDCVVKAVKDINKKREQRQRINLYTFNIWTFNVRKRNSPRLVINIDNEFKEKVRALKEFKSQKMALLQLTPVVYIKALLSGWKHDCKFAEEFHKVI